MLSHGMLRRDIEGLRAIAVAAVVLYHAGAGLSGGFVGVDVFFVVSGFLITTLLVDERSSTGRISLSKFYARRARRLLPASALVIVATVLASRALLEPLRLRDIGTDAIASGGFFANMVLAARSTDYLQSDLPPSPFQHFWSLSVEEQYYIVWPALLMVLLWNVRQGRARALTVVSATTIASFILCVWQTGTSQPWAFFGLHTRAWELGIGALVALAWPTIQTLDTRLRIVLGWAGVLGIVASVMIFDETMAFPGRIALLPVVSTALVLMAGDRTRGGPQEVLRFAPLQWIGGRSYSIYLWHWPILIIAEGYAGAPLTAQQRLAAVALALGAATLSHQLLENPIRHSERLQHRPRLALGLGAALIAVSVGFGAVLQTSSVALSTDEVAELPPVIVPTLPEASSTTTSPDSVVSPQQPDATGPKPEGPAPDVANPTSPLDVLGAALETKVVPANLTPSLRAASGDKPLIYSEDCHVDIGSAQPAVCEYGDIDSDFTVALYGDSHAAQWFPALNQVALDNSWRLVPLTKTGCTPIELITYNSLVGPTYPECKPWRERVMQRLVEENVSVIFIGYSNRLQDPNTREPFSDPKIKAGFAELIPRLREMGISPIVITDTPYPGQDVPTCLSKSLNDVEACTFTRDKGIRATRQQTNIDVAVENGAQYLDTSHWVCTDTMCPVISGNLLMYRDSNHITTTYAQWLTPFFSAAVTPYVNGVRDRR
jgi:peptidoglycan/LPS O-acetylase OafA/YrhL